jgi:prophage regulatory protein
MKPAMLALSDAAAYVALSTRQVQRLCQSEKFPKPRQLSGQRVAWVVRELDAWIDALPVSSIAPVGAA